MLHWYSRSICQLGFIALLRRRHVVGAIGTYSKGSPEEETFLLKLYSSLSSAKSKIVPSRFLVESLAGKPLSSGFLFEN